MEGTADPKRWNFSVHGMEFQLLVKRTERRSSVGAKQEILGALPVRGGRIRVNMIPFSVDQISWIETAG
jgi:hypothetical protein